MGRARPLSDECQAAKSRIFYCLFFSKFFAKIIRRQCCWINCELAIYLNRSKTKEKEIICLYFICFNLFCFVLFYFIEQKLLKSYVAA